MFCSKCGRIIEENTKFCGGCGTPVPAHNNTMSQENITQNKEGQNYNTYVNQGQVQTNYSQTYQNYDNVVNPSMKKYAVLSIVIPVVLFLVFCCIGTTLYVAILVTVLGFNCAKKGELYSKNLSRIGYVLNTILAVLIGISLLGNILA